MYNIFVYNTTNTLVSYIYTHTTQHPQCFIIVKRRAIRLPVANRCIQAPFRHVSTLCSPLLMLLRLRSSSAVSFCTFLLVKQVI